MKTKPVAFLLLALTAAAASSAEAITGPGSHKGEKISYQVFPVGNTDYEDFGLVSLDGVQLHLVTLTTKAPLLEDTEKIYSDPASSLPVKVEREVSGPLWKQTLLEEYDQKKGTVTVREFKDGKQVTERTFEGGGPIQNAILVSFYLRKYPNPKIGWHFDVTILPNKYRIELAAVEQITVPAGTFESYHFKSTPDKFDIWIAKDGTGAPLKIQGKGVFNYALSMKEYGGRKEQPAGS